MMHIGFRQRRIELPPGISGRAVDTDPYSFDRPCWARYLRIYQRVQHAMSGDTWDVLRDAIIDGNRDEAGQILASDDVMPGWRRSSVHVDRWLDYGSQRIYANDVLAGALWDVDMKKLVQRTDCFGLTLSNYEDHAITIQPILVCADVSDLELDQLRSR